MKSLIFFMPLLILTACVAKEQKSKIYTNKIELLQSPKKKVLYAREEQEKLPAECYKINFPDTEIAGKRLQMEMMRRLNEHNKSFIPIAQKELKEFQKFIADLKAKISERAKQYKQIKELKKQIKESNHEIEQLKSGDKNGY